MDKIQHNRQTLTQYKKRSKQQQSSILTTTLKEIFKKADYKIVYRTTNRKRTHIAKKTQTVDRFILSRI